MVSTNALPLSASNVMSAVKIETKSSVSPAFTLPRRGISDLPTELLLIIIGHLWPQARNPDNWYDPYDHSSYYIWPYQRQMRKDTLALASCSKTLRQRIFHEWMMAEVTVRWDGEELERLAALSEDARHSVR
jgi:hypothetical protein